MIRKFAFALSLALVPALAAQAPPAAGNSSNPGPFAPRAGTTTYPKPGARGSSNMKVLSHVPLGGFLHVSDIELEQELSRPYAYVDRRFQPSGFDIINLKDPSKAFVMYSWRIENPELHLGSGALGPMYVKSKGRYYFFQTFQFSSGGPDNDLAAIVFDMTGLPDTSKIKELVRIKGPGYEGGFHENFAYKHSSGAALVFTDATGGKPQQNIYDIDKVVSGAPNFGQVGRVPNPSATDSTSGRGYHDSYVAYDPANKRDLFYGAGSGGYYVYDVTDLQNPKLVTSVTGVAGMTNGHTFTPEPTGRYAIIESEYMYAPLRIVDLKPGLDGTVKTISRPIGAWTADWHDLAHNHEVRWPYVFVGAYEDGLQVFNMMDPTNPYTVGYYRTWDGPHESRSVNNANNGAWQAEVRNADGLIVVADMSTGFWAFKMEGFDGWNGHQWGVPNTSSAQDWDNGPDGAPKPQKVS